MLSGALSNDRPEHSRRTDAVADYHATPRLSQLRAMKDEALVAAGRIGRASRNEAVVVVLMGIWFGEVLCWDRAIDTATNDRHHSSETGHQAAFMAE
jgi:hypothetical protein